MLLPGALHSCRFDPAHIKQVHATYETVKLRFCAWLIRQSSLDSVLGFQVEVLEMFPVVPSSLGGGLEMAAVSRHAASCRNALRNP